MVPAAKLRRACASAENRQRLNCPNTHRRNVDEGACLNFALAPLSGCEFKNSKAIEMEFALFTTRL